MNHARPMQANPAAIPQAEKPTTITASRDLSCVNQVKYIYRFMAPIEAPLIQQFSDCDVRQFQFSQLIPSAKDLIRIRKSKQFQADFIVGGNSVVVYFFEYIKYVDISSMIIFNEYLRSAGLGEVFYVEESRSGCENCPVKDLKKCLSE